MIIDAELEISEQVLEADFSVAIESGSGGGDSGDYDEGYADGQQEVLGIVNGWISNRDMETAETAEDIPSRLDEAIIEEFDYAYGQGKQAEYDAFWDAYQVNGNRTNYAETFRGEGWTEANFKPKYDIILGSGETNKNMFNNSRINGDLVEICEKQGITIDFAKCTRFEYTFNGTRFTRVGIIDARNATITSGMFAYSSVLKTIDKIIMAEATVLANNAFGGCTALENITFDGVINTNVKLANSSNFSVASVQSIIDHLKDLTGATAKTITLHKDVGAKLTDAQKASASAKNWTLAY